MPRITTAGTAGGLPPCDREGDFGDRVTLRVRLPAARSFPKPGTDGGGSLHYGPKADGCGAGHGAMIDVRPQVYVLVDHHHEPIAGPDLQGVRDREAGACVFLPELAELLTERGGGDLLRVVAIRGLSGAL